MLRLTKRVILARQAMRNFLPHRSGKSSSFFHLNPLLLPLEWNLRKQSLVTAVVVYFWVCNKASSVSHSSTSSLIKKRRKGGIERCSWVAEHHTKKNDEGFSEWKISFVMNKKSANRQCWIFLYFWKGLTFLVHLRLFKEGFEINQNRNFQQLFINYFIFCC